LGLIDFCGSYVAIVTPMCRDGVLSLDSLGELVETHVRAGMAGIVAAGTTGEAASLSSQEYSAVIRTVVEQVAGRCQVIAGAGAPATARAIELAHLAEEAEADALLCVTPYYLRTTQAGLVAHYRAISDAVDLPLVLYNVPGRTGVDLLPETVANLLELESVCAIKEAVAGELRVRQLRSACNDRISVLSGDDASCLEAMLAGARGVISVTANIAPVAMVEICRLVAEGRQEEARALDARLQVLHRLLMAEPNPISVKAAMAGLGVIPAGLRLPLVEATPELVLRLDQAINKSGDLVTIK
jgi:4-hydroxy-tetrahydrodipicolinate synthase